MEFSDYLRVVASHWLQVLAVTLAGTGLGLAYAMLATPTYSASATVFVSTSDTATVADLATGSLFTQQRVATYAGLVEKSAVLQPVIDELNLATSVEGLATAVTASTPLNTTVIEITAVGPDPAAVADLASATAHQLIVTVEDIETTNPEQGSPVRLTIVQDASVPTAPTAPQKTFAVALGTSLGLALGMAIIIIRAVVDTRIRDGRDLARVTNAPLLGGIGFDVTVRKRPLIVQHDSLSPLAESFRTLRTNLQFLDAERGDRSFVVTSSVPAEGKSTVAANLAITIADAGSSVALVGADLRRPDVAQYMGLEAGVGLTDVLIGRVELEDAIQQWGESGLFVLPSGAIPPNPSELLGGSLMQGLISRLNEQFDVVIYDSPPLLPVTDAGLLARIVGGAILVVAAGQTRRDELIASIDALRTAGAPLSGIVLTKVRATKARAQRYERYGREVRPPKRQWKDVPAWRKADALATPVPGPDALPATPPTDSGDETPTKSSTGSSKKSGKKAKRATPTPD